LKYERREILWLAILVIGAALFRALLQVIWPNTIWPDEIFQTLEPAHRAVFNFGITAWEFRDAARSWLFPGFLAGVMKATESLGPGSLGYILSVTILLSLVSMTPAVAAWAWTKKLSGKNALWAACSVAFWSDLVFFGPKALNEAIAAHLLVIGVYFARFHDEKRWRIVLSGTMLGLALALRFHLAPAIFLVAWYVVHQNWRTKFPLMGSGVFGVFSLAGLLDAITWDYPFQSYWVSFRFNILQSGSHNWGVSPIWQYIAWYGNVWSFGVILLGLAILFWRRDRLLVASGLTILLVHSVLAHKEYRFIYPATVLIVLAASLELFFRIEVLPKCFQRLKIRHIAPLLAFAGWISLSAVAANRFTPANTGNIFGPGETETHFRWLEGRKKAFLYLSSRNDVCGIGLENIPWYLSGGYSYLHQDVPIFLVDQQRSQADYRPFFNTIVTKPNTVVSSEWRLLACFDDTCVYMRSGPCKALPGYNINQVLENRGQ
jgi:GPI mannosyltransferase 3